MATTFPVQNFFQGFNPIALDAAAAASGQAFLVGELEKRDPRLNEPLVSYNWMRDMPVVTGGGWVDFTSNYFVDYATAGANQYGIIGNDTTVIPIVQANVSKDTYAVFNWGNAIRVPFIDQQKMNQIGRSLDQLYDEGLRINYNKFLDQNVYLGLPEYGTYGLVNSPDVTSIVAPIGPTNHKRDWPNKTPTEIMDDMNQLLNDTWANSEYDITGMANQINLPPTRFAYICNTPVTSAGAESIMSYFMKNNIAAEQGRQLTIVPERHCIGQGVPLTTEGAGGSNRMVAFANDEKRICFDITVPVTRSMVEIRELAYFTYYLAQVGQVKFKYLQTIEYMDGI